MKPAMAEKSEAAEVIAAAAQAKIALAKSSAKARNGFLEAFAKGIEETRDDIMEANALDVGDATQAGLSSHFIDRLDLKGASFDAMVASVLAVADLSDPLADSEKPRKAPSGIMVRRISVPLGLVCFIYESRPGVTAEGASLCVKSGNAAILRGGKESLRSCLAIASAGKAALAKAGLPEGALGMLSTSSHQELDKILADGRLDMVIPRGGAGLVGHVMEISRAPVLAHLHGNCHIYVHDKADLKMASEVVINAKCNRPSTCNALESLLVDSAVAKELIPGLAKQLAGKGVEIVGCARTVALCAGKCSLASDDDWDKEYLALKLSVKVVDGLGEAISWINAHGSAHTDGIVSKDNGAIEDFIRSVDSSSIMVNTSTRFADGFEYGLGAETGISTGKLHARGPVGLDGLTSRKWVVQSEGMTRG